VIPGLKELTCSSSPIYEIPPIVGLRQIIARFCARLIGIPMIVGLEYLDCSHSANIIAISAIQELKKLICMNCSSLEIIPVLPALEELDVTACRVLNSIPLLPKLNVLMCSECPLLLIIYANNSLQKLFCLNCNNLRFAPNMYDNGRCIYRYSTTLTKTIGKIKLTDETATLAEKLYSSICLWYRCRKLIQYSLHIQQLIYSDPRQAYMRWMIESGSYYKELEGPLKFGVVNNNDELIWYSFK